MYLFMGTIHGIVFSAVTLIGINKGQCVSYCIACVDFSGAAVIISRMPLSSGCCDLWPLKLGEMAGRAQGSLWW